MSTPDNSVSNERDEGYRPTCNACGEETDVVPWEGSYVRQCQTCGFANTLDVKLLLPGHESDKNPYHGLSWDESPLPALP